MLGGRHLRAGGALRIQPPGHRVWVSVWGDAKPGEVGEIVVYDDATLEEIARIEDLITPTGKFNVYNTVNDMY